VVIALVRSELSADVLTRAEEHLLADSGRLLRDLVRTLMALDVASASRLFAGADVNLPDEIAGLSVPDWSGMAAPDRLDCGSQGPPAGECHPGCGGALHQLCVCRADV
jgi:hypothetical protein